MSHASPVADLAADLGADLGADLARRPVHWTDIPRLARLDEELFGGHGWSEGTWWAELAARPRRSYLVLTEGPDICGYAGVDLAGHTADVMTIAVAPAYRGRGLGRRLLDALVVEAVSSGAEALLLEVRADNEAALALYAGAGFERLQVRRRYYQPEDVDAVVMRRLLAKETP